MTTLSPNPPEEIKESHPWRNWFFLLWKKVTYLENRVTVSATAPVNPAVNDLWYDIS